MSSVCSVSLITRGKFIATPSWDTSRARTWWGQTPGFREWGGSSAEGTLGPDRLSAVVKRRKPSLSWKGAVTSCLHFPFCLAWFPHSVIKASLSEDSQFDRSMSGINRCPHLCELHIENPHQAMGFPGGSDGKESACNAGDLGLIPGSGRSPGKGNGYPLQYSCLVNPKDRGAWWVTVHGVTNSGTRQRG